MSFCAPGTIGRLPSAGGTRGAFVA